nr:hypothetical protein GCM10020092_002510 [Actinoplanes digitatis]
MPADIFARLDAALLEASATRGSSPDAGTGSADSTQGARHDPVDADDPGGARVIAIGTARERASGRGTAAPGAPASDGATPDQRPVAVPFDARRRRTRRLRGAAGVGIAAGVLAFAGFGAQQLAVSTDSQTASSAGSAADRAADQGAPQSAELAVPGVPPMQITESGLDYRQATLGQAGAHTLAAPNASDADKLDGSRSSASAPTAKSETTDALSRLRVQAALIACIDAIADKSGLAPITAQSVDFARYDGALSRDHPVRRPRRQLGVGGGSRLRRVRSRRRQARFGAGRLNRRRPVLREVGHVCPPTHAVTRGNAPSYDDVPAPDGAGGSAKPD